MEPKFSERIGKRQVRVEIQRDSMDLALKNGIWNILVVFIIEPMKKRHALEYSEYKEFIGEVWFSFLKEPIDTIPYLTQEVATNLRQRFFEKWDYLEIYDFIEFIASAELFGQRLNFIEYCNDILKRELSGYRFVNGQLAPITREEEINEIETALSSTSNKALQGVNIHLAASLKKISDKQHPDYRNSIKESISAVEALCQLITNDPKAELGKALKLLKGKLPIHGALEQGFIKIYGYTSDSDGIRHALLEESTLDQEDALFMLISCSAFINYLLAKVEKTEIKLK